MALIRLLQYHLSFHRRSKKDSYQQKLYYVVIPEYISLFRKGARSCDN